MEFRQDIQWVFVFPKPTLLLLSEIWSSLRISSRKKVYGNKLIIIIKTIRLYNKAQGTGLGLYLTSERSFFSSSYFSLFEEVVGSKACPPERGA